MPKLEQKIGNINTQLECIVKSALNMAGITWRLGPQQGKFDISLVDPENGNNVKYELDVNIKKKRKRI